MEQETILQRNQRWLKENQEIEIKRNKILQDEIDELKESIQKYLIYLHKNSDKYDVIKACISLMHSRINLIMDKENNLKMNKQSMINFKINIDADTMT